jgi:hypothetical protein
MLEKKARGKSETCGLSNFGLSCVHVHTTAVAAESEWMYHPLASGTVAGHLPLREPKQMYMKNNSDSLPMPGTRDVYRLCE